MKLTRFCRSIICIIGGGIAAGLTIGLMSLDNGIIALHSHFVTTTPIASPVYRRSLIICVVELELLIESGDPKEAGYAKKLAPIRKRVCKKISVKRNDRF